MIGHTLCQQTVHVSLMPYVLQSIMAMLKSIAISDPHRTYEGRLMLQGYDVHHTAITSQGGAYRDNDRHRLELGVFKPQRFFEDVLYLIGCERASNLRSCTHQIELTPPMTQGDFETPRCLCGSSGHLTNTHRQHKKAQGVPRSVITLIV